MIKGEEERMKKVILVLNLIGLVGCGSATTGALTSSSSSSSGSNLVSFTNKANSSTLLINNGSIGANDLANGQAYVGDNGAQPARWVISIPLTGLSGKTLQTGYLNIYYDSEGPQSEVANLGAVKAFKIPQHVIPDATDWGAVESNSVTVFANDAAHAIANKTKVQIDMKAAIQAAINAGDTHVTFKIRFNTDLGAGNNIIQFYCTYNSVVLAPYIPAIEGTY
jgi:hypothetical protein